MGNLICNSMYFNLSEFLLRSPLSDMIDLEGETLLIVEDIDLGVLKLVDGTNLF